MDSSTMSPIPPLHLVCAWLSPPLALALSPLSLHYTDTLMYIFSLALALFDIKISKQGTM